MYKILQAVVVLGAFLFIGISPIVAQNEAIGMSSLKQAKLPTSNDSTLQIKGVIPFSDLNLALQYKDNVKSLNLQNQNLTKFPIEILQFKNLEILDLSHNALTDIPNDIAQLQQLQFLCLNNNKLSTIPASIGSIQTLHTLLLDENRQDFILPAELENLNNLKYIKLSNLKTVPNYLWNMKSLENLRILNSHLAVIPSDIQNLTQLKQICLMNNDLTEIPVELYKLSNLDYLSVGYNKITQINSAVNNLKKLTYFGVFGNPISTLELSDKFINHLDFFSAWDTKLPEDYFKSLNPKSAKTQINSSGKGIK